MYDPKYTDDLRGVLESFKVVDFEDGFEPNRKLIEKAMEEPEEDPSIPKKKKGRTKPKHRRKKR